MKGYVRYGESLAQKEPKHLEGWEAKVVEAIGSLIEFWGFKRNQGRLWALLYLRGRSMAASELQELLSLSKGSVSTLTRDLEHWHVIHRLRVPGENVWHFRAETDLLKMISHVIEQREAKVVQQVRADLEEALYAAKASGWALEEELRRIEQMLMLSKITETLVFLILQAGKLNMEGIYAMLKRLSQRMKKE